MSDAAPQPAPTPSEHWCALEHGGVFCKVCDAAPLASEPEPVAAEQAREADYLLSEEEVILLQRVDDDLQMFALGRYPYESNSMPNQRWRRATIADVEKRFKVRAPQFTALCVKLVKAALASQGTPPPDAQVEYELDRAFKAGMAYREKLASPVASTPPPAHNSTMIYGALTDKARARTSRENIDDVLDALATMASQSTPPPESAGQGLSDAEIDTTFGEHNVYGSITTYAAARRFARAILAANRTAQPDGGSKA